MGCLVVLLLLPLNGSTIFDQESRVPELSRELIDDDLLPGRLRRSQADQRARQRRRQREMDRDRERPNDRGYSAEFQTIQTKDPYIIMACHGKLIHSQDDGCCAANSPLSPPQSVIIFQPLLCFCFCVSSSSSAFQFLPFLTPLFHCIFCFFFF